MSEWEQRMPNDPLERPFAELERSSNGRFEDDDLAKILTESVDDCAGAFGANQVPLVLRTVEILGIKQARSWNLASLNEFRKHFKLAPHRTFEDINPDPMVADQLKRLYDHPDSVELYPGVAVEDTKESVKPGSGLCTTFTISRAILSDAVALVRGDRFYTVDYTPKSLTNWGFSLVNYDLNTDAGCVFYKLILRALPQNFRQDSVYAHYPLVIPSENHSILTELGQAGDYSFDKPTRIASPIFISSYAACKSILENQTDFKVMWGEVIEFLLRDDTTGPPNGTDFMLAGDGPRNKHSRNLLEQALYPECWRQEVKSFYEHTTLKLLHRNAYKVAGQNQVDIVRDVSNLVQVRFVAAVFSLPLKTAENPRGMFSETELYLVMAVVFSCIFFDVDPAKSFPLRHAARDVAQKLGKLVELNARFIDKTKVVHGLLEMFYRHEPLSMYGTHLIRRLLESNTSVKELVWTHIMPTTAAMVANQSQLFSQCLDYYLSDEGKVHLPEINRLAKEDTAQADDKLLH
jgi:linoleate 8R-lipoxygenase / 9,12-octadecadienoate 8-hydroperoxide 8R-isomerase